jgi:hypothetical protein
MVSSESRHIKREGIMKRDEAFFNSERILSQLSHLPKKIISLEGIENTPEFVLHELCNEHCFNLSKAAFLVDSPDFNYVKGVAGYDVAQAYPNGSQMWQDPDAFSNYMQKMPFNQQVRSIADMSLKHGSGFSQDRLKTITHGLGFNKPAYLNWKMKHDNYGLLIYEYNGFELQGLEEHLSNSLYLLSFCPVF